MKFKALRLVLLSYSIGIFAQGTLRTTITDGQGELLSYAHLMLF